MRYAIVSDIHSNLEALESVINEIKTQSIEQIYCCGDLVGYYSNPNECITLLRDVGAKCILGNHDVAALGDKDYQHFWSVARNAIDWTRKNLSKESEIFLRGLPKKMVMNDFLLFHGALHLEENSEDLHLTEESDIIQSVHKLSEHPSNIHVGFFGHTHHRAVYEIIGGELQRHLNKAILIDENSRLLVNPGSVGQSRDGDWRASFVIYDTCKKEIFFHRIPYERNKTLHKAKKQKLLEEPWHIRKTKRAFRKIVKVCNF